MAIDIELDNSGFIEQDEEFQMFSEKNGKIEMPPESALVEAVGDKDDLNAKSSNPEAVGTVNEGESTLKVENAPGRLAADLGDENYFGRLKTLFDCKFCKHFEIETGLVLFKNTSESRGKILRSEIDHYVISSLLRNSKENPILGGSPVEVNSKGCTIEYLLEQ